VLAATVVAVVMLRKDSDRPASCPADRSVVAVSRPGEIEGTAEVALVTAEGQVTVIPTGWTATEPSFGPSGEELVVVKAEGDYESAGPGATDLWVLRSDGAVVRGLTEGANASSPDWSPVDDTIVYSEFVEGRFELRTLSAEGDEAPETLLGSDDGDRLAPEWSPDGSQIAFVNRTSPGERGDQYTAEVWTVDADGGSARSIGRVPDAHSVAWAPEGDRLLVSTFRGENGRVFLLDSAGGEGQVVARGATSATWARNGSVYYFTKEGAAPGSHWRLAEGHLDDDQLGRDRFLGDESVYLYGYFGTSARPCPTR
jgi:dipeptidyl aminopeptidase/acylaminoacyl peptidase